MTKPAITTGESEMSYGPIPDYICPDENSLDRAERVQREQHAQMMKNHQLAAALKKVGFKIEEWTAYA